MNGAIFPVYSSGSSAWARQNTERRVDIDERTYSFAIEIVNLTKLLPKGTIGFELGKQVLRSGTSIAANIEEAQGSFSKDDFIYKMNISLKEARETSFWLRLIKEKPKISIAISSRRL